MSKSSHKKKLILLIEDEEILLTLLRYKLEQAGYSVEVAADGVTGIEKVRALKPDLVLLDMLLPRKSGFQILEELHEEKIIPKLPIIIISNSGQPIEIERAEKLGVRDNLLKLNFDPEDVLNKVNYFFERTDAKSKKTPKSKDTPKSTKMEKEDISPKVTITHDRASTKNILVVEDDMLLSGLLRRKFEQQNLRVYQAADVEKARSILEDKKINLICLDVILPGINGFEFLEELKQSSHKDIPVLILSNLGQKEEVEKGLQLGAIDYIIKATMSPSEIVEKAKKLIK